VSGAPPAWDDMNISNLGAWVPLLTWSGTISLEAIPRPSRCAFSDGWVSEHYNWLQRGRLVGWWTGLRAIYRILSPRRGLLRGPDSISVALVLGSSTVLEEYEESVRGLIRCVNNASDSRAQGRPARAGTFKRYKEAQAGHGSSNGVSRLQQ